MFNSQQGEDKYLYENFLNFRDGFFIELGAMNGIIYSNSLFFENQLGWSGVLIEPTDQYISLVNNRPNCYNFNYAISEIEGEVEFIGNSALGGMTHTMHDNHRKGWNLDKLGDAYLVKSIPISKLLKNLNIKRVDLFSIDVEGGELEVLKTFDWNIPVYIVLIEISADETKNKLCREFLQNQEFIKNCDLGCNEVWINSNNNNNKNNTL